MFGCDLENEIEIIFGVEIICEGLLNMWHFGKLFQILRSRKKIYALLDLLFVNQRKCFPLICTCFPSYQTLENTKKYFLKNSFCQNKQSVRLYVLHQSKMISNIFYFGVKALSNYLSINASSFFHNH